MAFVIVQGTGCKKEVGIPQEEHVAATLKINSKADHPDQEYDPNGDQDGGGNGYPDNEFTFPHYTGACTCGKYPKCHPSPTTPIDPGYYPLGPDAGPQPHFPPR